jgi:hypothetical protein
MGWGVRTIASPKESHAKGLSRYVTGIWFPFRGEFGQLRVDQPKPESPKYLSPIGVKAQAWTPPGERAMVVTEGYKDGAIGILEGGIPTAAIAGVDLVTVKYRTTGSASSKTVDKRSSSIAMDGQTPLCSPAWSELPTGAPGQSCPGAPVGRRESRTSGVPKSWPQLRNTPTIGHDRRRVTAGTTNPLGGSVQGPPRRMHQKGAGFSRRPYRGKRSEQTREEVISSGPESDRHRRSTGQSVNVQPAGQSN